MEPNQVYQPLDSAIRQIRLLQLLPGFWDSPLQTDLQVTCLAAELSYHTLSYVWGRSTATRQIQLCRQPFEVTVNLFNALRRLRRAKETLLLWVDAICINQTDLEERGSQVAIMGEIYSKARGGYSWLGDSISGEKSGLAYLPVNLEDGKSYEWLSRNAEQIVQSSSFTDLEHETLAAFAMLHLLSIDEHWDKKVVFSVGDDGRFRISDRCAIAWQAMLRLMQLSWFRRIWVVQEFVLSENATLVLGSVSAPTELIIRVCGSFLKHLPPGTCCHTSVSWKMTGSLWGELVKVRLTLWSFYSLRVQHLQPCSKELPVLFRETMWLLRHKEATDARDKVYGFLGLLQNHDQPLLRPDYSLSVAETFVNYTKFLIASESNLIALVGPRLQHPGLPTWVPDVLPDAESRTILFFKDILRRIAFSTIFNASKGHKVTFTVQDTRIELSGVRVDTVQTVAGGYVDGQERKTVEEWESVLLSTQSSASYRFAMDVPVTEAFWRTIIRDTFTHSESAITRRAILDDQHSYSLFRSWLVTNFDAQPSHAVPGDTDFVNFRKSFYIATQGQHFFTTDLGYMGLGYAPREGDEVWVLFGGTVPFILRRTSRLGEYSLIGDCYVHGIMDGERMTDLKEGDVATVTLL